MAALDDAIRRSVAAPSQRSRAIAWWQRDTDDYPRA